MRITSRHTLAGVIVSAASLVAAVSTASMAAATTPTQPAPTPTGEAITITVTTNAISGGKNGAEADYFTTWVKPEFEKAMAAQGKNVTLTFEPNGVDDENYKTKQALDLKTGKGADLIGIDGIWYGEFADAGYIKPLDDLVGADVVNAWSGWAQIQPAVQALSSYNGKRYGIPSGTDGRVIYFNKEIFKAAGLPTDWQPTSWDDILTAARTIKEKTDAIPLQWNAGSSMGEATTMQGLLPLLAGTGAQVFADGKWLGGSKQLVDVLSFYATVYGSEQLGDPILQQEAQGRDRSFEQFSKGEIAILAEGDYFWRSVISPKEGDFAMANRDEVVGYAKIPAMKPGAGINGQDFVSMSGGGGFVINPNSGHPQETWQLMAFLSEADAIKARLDGSARVTARDDVNVEVLGKDPLLSFIAKEVLPITAYRPAFAVYPQVSAALQEATDAILTGTSPADAAAAYQTKVSDLVGADKVATAS
jgi:multiple sugar transport system substrate-binding protein